MCYTEDLTNSPRQPALKCLWISLQNSFEVLDIPKGNGNDKLLMIHQPSNNLFLHLNVFL